MGRPWQAHILGSMGAMGRFMGLCGGSDALCCEHMIPAASPGPTSKTRNRRNAYVHIVMIDPSVSKCFYMCPNLFGSYINAKHITVSISYITISPLTPQAIFPNAIGRDLTARTPRDSRQRENVLNADGTMPHP